MLSFSEISFTKRAQKRLIYPLSFAIKGPVMILYWNRSLLYGISIFILELYWRGPI